MPTYLYDCKQCDSVIEKRDASYDLRQIDCACGGRADRRPFYLDTAVTRLPTRGPIIPPRPASRSSKGENTDTWKAMLDEYAYEEHKHAKHYGRGGELADRWDEKPKGVREA